MRYDDFSLLIEPPQDGEYPVQVLGSPAGEGRGRMRLPAALRRLFPAGSESATRHVVAEEDDGAPEPPPTSAQEIGAQLFESLFAGQVRSLFEHSLGTLADSPDRGLRIKLCLDPENPDLARLAALPWELLYSRERREFLGLGRTTPVVRSLRVPRLLRPVLQPPLRILVLISSPRGLPPLDLARERRRIEDAWRGIPQVELEFLENASPVKLREELLARPVHVLHAMGHGDFSAETGEGVLMLADEEGEPMPVSGTLLADLLRDCQSLRLVFLNACDTGRSSDLPGRDPFLGVAAALLMAGVPAVVAMQCPVEDDAAIAFSSSFYARLAAGDPVDAAAAEGRLAVRVRDETAMDWSIPVLFLRTPDGRLFDPPSRGASPEVRREIIDFSRYLKEKTEGFVGRKWIFDAITQFTHEKPRGYLILRGDPGIGKSALVAQMVLQRGYIHHFNVRSDGIQRPDTFLRNVCSQLIATYGLENASLPPEATQDSRFLSSLLEKVSAKLQPGEKAILVVDALDEADSTLLARGANALYLPSTLPPGVYVVATSRRTEEAALRIECEQAVLYIEQDSAGNVADVRELVESKLPLPGIRSYLSAQSLDEAAFLAEMVAKSQGNFMYLRHVLPEVEAGVYKDRELSTLPIGLAGYYEDHWRRMRRRDEKAWFDFQLPVLVALTVSREPISLDRIEEFSQVQDRRWILTVVKEWDQFLYTTLAEDDGGRPQKRYRIYHTSFQEFIARKDEVADERVSLTAAHGKIADSLWRELYGEG
jgi:CHAT domain/NACHT domain